MNDALYIAATGMQAHQLGVDTIANNLANVATPGFKASRVNFQEMMYREQVMGNGMNGGLNVGGNAGAGLNYGLAQGSGVSVGMLSKLFVTGELRQTDSPLDLAIPGNGFIEVVLADGNTAYSRGGSLRVNSDGFLTTQDGSLLKPNIHVGLDAKTIKIGTDGRVMVTTGNQTSPAEVGRIEIATFTDPAGLRSLGRNLYASTERSGEAEVGRPGEDGFTVLAPGFVEASNVNLVDEMVNLMVAQRAYGMNVKVIQAADEMLGMSNNLRR